MLISNCSAALGIIHSFWLDQIIDSRGEAPGAPLRNIYLTHLVFGLYVDSWLALVNGSVAYNEFLAIEVETYSALFEEEIFHVGTSQTFRSQNIIAHKCSPVKSIAFAILALTGRSELNAPIVKVIESISLALCTLDDLLDWEEDYERGRITFPIQLALERLHCAYTVEKHEALKASIFREIFFGRIYHELMQEILKSLEESRLLALTFSPSLSSFINDCRSRTSASWEAYVRLLISYPKGDLQ